MYINEDHVCSRVYKSVPPERFDYCLADRVNGAVGCVSVCLCGLKEPRGLLDAGPDTHR